MTLAPATACFLADLTNTYPDRVLPLGAISDLADSHDLPLGTAIDVARRKGFQVNRSHNLTHQRKVAMVFHAMQEWDSVHDEGMTRREVVWQTRLANATVQLITTELLERGLLSQGPVVRKYHLTRSVRTVPGYFMDTNGRVYVDAHHPFAEDDDAS